ncbi:XRE family transcriptional regulator [Spirulina subsalsa FACHB-351]|uniref:XRE family transcriptional regulator n=1 Tax=Spirulina subsalsa FACHB-351 TaxID=234711 RepID=A0ABT3L5M5_9CYAN|nr:XRE family transcriptional regulator [Spirulina subsalsa]MCW6036801.1 XRE family transcriptional regulator [Spirulina subsalsa FACHB-351]
MKIGHAIRRLRHAQQMTLQQVCDLVGGNLQTGHLSRIEQDKLVPNVTTAALIARALGTTIDQLVMDAERGDQGTMAPSVSRRLIPVVEWKRPELDFSIHKDVGEKRPARWILPPMEVSDRAFAMVLQDDSMQALEGLSFSRGGAIIIEPRRKAQPGEYVLVGDKAGGPPLFRQLATDGRDHFLRPRNTQYPMRDLPEGAQVLGVVVGMVIDLTQGV